MKMLNLFVLLTLASAAFAEETTDSCLAKATLETLGFAGPGTLSVVDSPTYCTDLYASPGRCTDEGNVKTVIELYQDEFSTHNAGYSELASVFDTFFGNIGESITALWTKVTGDDDENKEKTWKAKMAEEISNAKENHDKCFMTYNQLSHGLSCLLTSGLAAQKSTLSGETLTVSTGESALQLVTDCMTVVSAVCMYYKGGAEAELTIPQSDSQKALCAEHNTYVKCLSDGGNDSSCLTVDIKKKFFANMFSPYKNKWLPSVQEVKDTTDKILEWFASVKDKVFSWFKDTDSETTETTTTTRLLSSTMTLVFDFGTDGADLYAYGGKSGVPVKGINIHHFGILSIMIAFLLRLN